MPNGTSSECSALALVGERPKLVQRSSQIVGRAESVLSLFAQVGERMLSPPALFGESKLVII